MNRAGTAKALEKANPAGARPLQSFWQKLMAWSRRPARRLRLCEMLSLGDRRFVAVLEFEGMRFLVGGTAASLVLLDRLGSPATQSSSNSDPWLGCAPGGSR